jgi:hypothetical protein
MLVNLLPRDDKNETSGVKILAQPAGDLTLRKQKPPLPVAGKGGWFIDYLTKNLSTA